MALSVLISDSQTVGSALIDGYVLGFVPIEGDGEGCIVGTGTAEVSGEGSGVGGAVGVG